MEFVVATSTIGTFAESLFTGTLDLAMDIVSMIWPYLLTVALVFAVVRIVRRLIHLR